MASPPVMAVSEADSVILPPPTTLNPIPSLPAALRLDNREQIQSLLTSNPVTSSGGVFRQLLVFGTDSLRTLLLRQVLNDPHSTVNNATAGRNQKQTKKNWESHRSFAWPTRDLQASIVGTRLLLRSSKADQANDDKSKTNFASIQPTMDGGAEVSLHDHGHSTGSPDTSPELPKEHVDVITYFLKPFDLLQTKAVIQRVQRWRQMKPNIYHRIVYLPQVTALVHQVLTDAGLLISNNPGTSSTTTASSSTTSNNVSVQELQLDLFPLESDVISLEYDAATQEPLLEGMPSPLVTTCARALLKLQDITGTIPRIQSIGRMGEDVLAKSLHQSVDEYLATAGSQEAAHTGTTSTSTTQLPDNNLAMVLIDRNVDMVTPMVSPLTYEGLLDELVGIDGGFIQIPLDTIHHEDDDDGDKKPAATTPSNKKEWIMLGVHAGDTLYAEVRDQHVEKFGSFLQNQAKALQASHANFTNKETKKDLSEIHQFVKQIPMFTQNLRSLTNHIHLAELIKAHTEQNSFREQWQTERSMMEGEVCYDMLEEWICSGYPADKVLRLLCLQSLCAGGLKGNRYDSLRSQIVQQYGYEVLLTLHGLETAGWIRRKDTMWSMDSANNSPFGILRRSLILIHAEVDTVEPDDVAYVSSGYAPLSVRLVQSAVQGWAKKAEIVKEIPGRLLDIRQCHPPQDLPATLQSQPRSVLAPSVGGGIVAEASLGDYAKKQQKGTAVAQTVKKPTLIVVYLGGLTYMEIAALRFLSKRPSFPYHIVMVTTKIINGSTLVKSMG